MDIESILNKIRNVLTQSTRDRDLNISGVYNGVEDKLYDEGYEYPWIMELMSSSEGQYAVFQAGGKLYRANYSVDSSDNVTIGEIFQVKIDYPRVEEEESRVRVFRNKDTNALQWVCIASSSVLNRVGEIDTTELFDDFENNFDEENLPYLTLQHLPKEFSFGTVRGIFRLNNLLFAFGEIDEETLLGRFAAENFNTGKFGISIGFFPDEKPRMIDIDGVEIPTYNKGTLVEVSALFEERAAAYFTNIMNVSRGNMGVKKKQAKETLLEFVGDGNEEEVDALLEEAGTRERQIEDDGLVTRDVEDVEEDEVDEEENDNVETEIIETEETEIVLDDEFAEKIVDDVSKRVIEFLEPQLKKIDDFKKEIDRELKEFTESISRINTFIDDVKVRDTSVNERFNKLETEEKDKIRDVINDLPASSKRTVIVNHRPTKDNSDKEGVGEERISLRSMSKDTLEKIDSKNK